MSDKQRVSDVIELARPYGRFALGAVMFTGCALLLAHEAETNDRGLIINGIIHLDPGGADAFYAVLAALSTAFVVVAILGIRALHARKVFRVVIGKKAVTLPATFRAWEAAPPPDDKIRYEDLVSIALSPNHLKIVRRDGGPVLLAKHFVPDGLTLRELSDRIMSRARERADAQAARAAKAAARDAADRAAEDAADDD
jgi:hypothetical protein